MKNIFFYLIFIIYCSLSYTQTINLNESPLIDYLRRSQLLGTIKSDFSFTTKPIHLGKNGLKIENSIFNLDKYSPIALNFLEGKGLIKILPIDFNSEYSSHHPYNRNNGSLIPNRGYQQLISAGIYVEIGPLSIQLKPENIFAQNLKFEGFPESHPDEIWAERYQDWNHYDIPERFGEKPYRKNFLGQSSIRLNWKGISIGLSSENIWWGPSIRNSIMMSNHAKGFNHLTFNSTRPLKTKIGSFEWQLVSGRLESSGFTPPNPNKTYAGTLLYVPKINQSGNTGDWRYFQGYTLTYSPKWISGLSLGIIRWVQMYGALLNGEYTWMNGKPDYFPVFSNLFRKNDKYVDIEEQTDQAAGVFLRWLWKESKTEIYAEFHYNDSKVNLRDLIIDSDHSRATTLGIQKIFKIQNNNYLFSWEWTQLEQSASRVLRNAGSWYHHNYVYDGYTNRGEVLGAGIGPGSNAHFFSVSKFDKTNKIGISIEVIDQDNDFYYTAYRNTGDFRRYWKDFNLQLDFSKKYKKFWSSINLIYSRSLNYQWELEENASSYYHPGKDVNNFHANIKITYEIPLN